uniref:Uncharacterized protein n=1 Tax=Leptocylindrus danicus TaxID=163516 RepID=A0A7S2L537_9STRA
MYQVEAALVQVRGMPIEAARCRLVDLAPPCRRLLDGQALVAVSTAAGQQQASILILVQSIYQCQNQHQPEPDLMEHYGVMEGVEMDDAAAEDEEDIEHEDENEDWDEQEEEGT